MSLIRTGHTPDAWRDEGPAHYVPRAGHGIRGRTESGYVPFVVLPIVQSDAERRRMESRRVGKLRGESLAPPRPVCGAPMWYEETCARMPGHRDSHRSRTVMDADRDARHARMR